MIKKVLFCLLVLLIWLVNGYEVDLPSPTSNIHSEVVIDSSNSSSSPYYEILAKTFTTYIWMFTGVVAFILVLTAWYWLLTAQGKAEDLKKANKMLVWGLVGIFVSLLSYVIIKVLINLF